MPTYEYVCKKCGHGFEAFQSMTAAPLRHCPKCKGAVRRKVGSGGGIIFKGSGFYETDYKRKSGSPDAGGEKEKEKEKESKPAEAPKSAEVPKDGPKDSAPKGDKKT